MRMLLPDQARAMGFHHAGELVPGAEARVVPMLATPRRCCSRQWVQQNKREIPTLITRTCVSDLPMSADLCFRQNWALSPVVPKEKRVAPWLLAAPVLTPLHKRLVGKSQYVLQKLHQYIDIVSTGACLSMHAKGGCSKHCRLETMCISA